MASLRQQIAAIRLAVAKREPKVLTAIGEASVRNGTDTLTSRQIEGIIKDVRLHRRKRNPAAKARVLFGSLRHG
jgi:hypothetical protein